MLNRKLACKEESKHAKMGGGRQGQGIATKMVPSYKSFMCSRPVWPGHCSSPGNSERVVRVGCRWKPTGLWASKVVDMRTVGSHGRIFLQRSDMVRVHF